MQAAIDQFVDKLIQEKNMEGLGPEVLQQIKFDLKSRVEDRVNAAILTALPQSKLVEFEKLLDSKSSSDKITDFCRQNISNLDNVLAEALLAFRNTYLNL
jgi:hypothetical protein